MRTEEEMFRLFDRIAREDQRIRVLTLEGSRVNPSVKKDVWQDYDITFLVTDVKSFTASDEWLKVFGDKIIFMQKPEAMELFPPDFPEGWFSYLVLFRDGIKIDLTLIEVDQAEVYFASDPLIKVLLDKDGIAPELPEPSDEKFWIGKPSQTFVTECANEFFFVSTYIARALFRKELLFAQHLTETILHKELLRMLGYLAGVRSAFPVNPGKHNRWLPSFLTEGENDRLMETYVMDTLPHAQQALDTAMQLFDQAMREVCSALGYEAPGYYETIRDYLETIKALVVD